MDGEYSVVCAIFCFFQAEDGIRDLVRSRGLGDVYKRQALSLFRCFREKIRVGQVAKDMCMLFMKNFLQINLSLIHI